MADSTPLRNRLRSVDPGRMARRLAGAIAPPPDLADAACARMNPSVFVLAGGWPDGRALAACEVCPVLAPCRRYAAGLPRRHRRSVVLGGLVYGNDGHPRAG